uniref:Splicing factor 3A subunit 3-like n=2 Tax=Hirondellea gigas TaxID=1518452 RepID=A0A6A7FTZ1_9CRUS
MDTILEQQRRYHEERERLTDCLAKECLHKKTSLRENINSDHRMRLQLDRHVDCSEKLFFLYEDKDGLRKEEVAALSGPNEIGEFYNRLKQIRDFHKVHPNEISIPMSIEFEELNKLREHTDEMTTMVDFTDEEGYGKYLDLHHVYNQYCNIKGLERISYITFLGLFDRLQDIAKDKKNSQYREYLFSLLDYLHSYVQRVKPLLDMSQELENVTKDFAEQWENGKFPGWPKESGGALALMGAHLDLSAFSSSSELMSLGLDRLKSALLALGLKCGGTLEERAHRLFLTKGKNIGELDSSLFSKSKAGKNNAGTKEAAKNKDLATIESQVFRLVELLAEQKVATKENVQRKQARKDGEEDEEEDASASESDDEDDEVPYNPKNLPLGWDGKPIPYWLYKLHGLNISYTCEICANFTYKGPKAFQRHFAEWRHAHGMRCLGIPNTAHFANVTSIEDALKLWEKLKEQKNGERWQAETEEEYEDSSGNVFNRKTFNDLKKQGLL